MFISSSNNELFKNIKSLLNGREIRRQKHFLVFGEKILRESLERGNIEQLIFSEQNEPKLKSLNFAKTLKNPIFLNNDLFAELDIFGTQFPLGIGTYPSWGQFTDLALQDGIYIMLALQDPSNVGAALRSCAAFGFTSVVLLQECAHPFHPKSLRASSGAALNMNYFLGPSISDICTQKQQSNELPILALDFGGTPLHTFSWPKSFGLLLGEEGRGVPAEFAGTRISIPMDFQSAESLNASTALALALYELRSRAFR